MAAGFVFLTPPFRVGDLDLDLLCLLLVGDLDLLAGFLFLVPPVRVGDLDLDLFLTPPFRVGDLDLELLLCRLLGLAFRAVPSARPWPFVSDAARLLLSTLPLSFPTTASLSEAGEVIIRLLFTTGDKKSETKP